MSYSMAHHGELGTAKSLARRKVALGVWPQTVLSSCHSATPFTMRWLRGDSLAFAESQQQYNIQVFQQDAIQAPSICDQEQNPWLAETKSPVSSTTQ